ncbi:helix-turn-helix domain-containing protein [Oenococcus kitaharae]|uniref:MerR family transcriptional regulator n=1 Tax=Oenococcus kitaharae DSM 17330 TaxID=1045004 RepID=G9WEY6_9LACO|nr:Rgg/GadR/MutR family transcriptional regulator [Oenococcus kitaharae]EHN58546.1 MerR family transcriptional regulator [Oenococcus kitaharae DSM 17330]OEY84737.1 hypothetical protein NT95_01310 [Oenococcus kitaharae]OEY85020.1 hypothetical protein NT96_02880 [Oenococcus kitaharae]OEY85811.1 hypothetical protein NV75_03185 [Oenococcus kitaharae]
MNRDTAKKAGAIFRKIRRQRQISTQQLAAGLLSVSSINKFENGHAKLSFTILAELSRRMNLRPDYFFQEIYKQEGSAYTIFLNKIKPIYESNDLPTLKKIAQKKALEVAHNPDFDLIGQLVTLFSLIKGIDQQYSVDTKMIEKIASHLLAIEYWDPFEISLFNNCLILFTSVMIKNLLKEILYSLDGVEASDRILSLLCNAADIFYRRKDYEAARKIMLKCETLFSDQTKLMIRFKLTFMKNLLSSSRKQAVIDNNKLIESLRMIGSNNLASSYEVYMRKYDFPEKLSNTPKKS